jgi:transposase
MRTIITIGLDLAKKVFQIHGVDAVGKVVVARKLRRKEVLAFFAKPPPCLVGMEACGSAHYWAREIAKLGHSVKLMLPKYVKAYVKCGKTDAGDAAAICEAVDAPEHVVRAGERARATRSVDAAQRALAADRSAHAAHQRAMMPISLRRPRTFVQRSEGQSGRIKRIMIVAVARKLAIALWRYLEQGLVPQGATLTR